MSSTGKWWLRKFPVNIVRTGSDAKVGIFQKHFSDKIHVVSLLGIIRLGTIGCCLRLHSGHEVVRDQLSIGSHKFLVL